MTEVKHTPTPWFVEGFMVRAESNRRGIAATRVQHAIPLSSSSQKFARQSALNQANAAHIVKCVNLHDELVETIQDLICAGEFRRGCEDLKSARELLKNVGAL